MQSKRPRRGSKEHVGGFAVSRLLEGKEKRPRQGLSSIMSSTKKSLVLSIIDFLNKSLEDGSIRTDDKEGIEVAGASGRV
jgi:hypothetical protein